MPNALSFLVLAAWPFVTIGIFGKLPVGRAVIWSLLVAYLFLPPPPAGIDPPLMPPLTKETLPSMSAFVVAFVLYGSKMTMLPRSWPARILMITFVVSPFATVLTNQEPVFFGRVGLPGLRLFEGLALMINQFMLLMPFILAYNFLAKVKDQRDLLIAFLGTGLVYSLLMLIEVRMAPQLNIWIYGFFQHQFSQAIRFGGFRPFVFLYHGLWVAFYALMVLAAVAALWRGEKKGRFKTFCLGATGYMWVVLFLCKSMASFLYSMVLIPLIVFFGRNTHYRVAAVLAFLAVAYPLAKGMGLVPTQYLLDQAAAFDAERSRSLEFRFMNEDVLLDRAYEKPLFGWGSWGRNHIHDPYTGNILTVTDGRWVIVIGVFGWVGFLAEFVLLAWPIFILAARSFVLTRDDEVSPWLGPLALILAFNLFDLLPNATITTLTWLISGAMLGYLEQGMERFRRDKEHLKSVM